MISDSKVLVVLFNKDIGIRLQKNNLLKISNYSLFKISIYKVKKLFVSKSAVYILSFKNTIKHLLIINKYTLALNAF